MCGVRRMSVGGVRRVSMGGVRRVSLEWVVLVDAVDVDGALPVQMP